jgi:hypothetical protein
MPGRARPSGHPESAPLTQVAAGRAWQGDAVGGRKPTGAPAPRPPVRLAEPPRSDVEGSVEERLERARRELERLDREYLTAVGDGVRARERAEIAAAFDRGDALQGRMLSTLHRARQLERELAGSRPSKTYEPPTPSSSSEFATDPDGAA